MIFCLSTIAPWHPSNAAPAAGVKVAMLDENPLRQEKPVWGYQSDLCLFGEVAGSLAALLGAPRSGDLLALTPIFVSAALVFAVGVGAAGLLERRRATLRR